MCPILRALCSNKTKCDFTWENSNIARAQECKKFCVLSIKMALCVKTCSAGKTSTANRKIMLDCIMHSSPASERGNCGKPNYLMQRWACILNLSFYFSLPLSFSRSLYPLLLLIELVTFMIPLPPTQQNSTRTGKRAVQFLPACRWLLICFGWCRRLQQNFQLPD